VAQPWKDILGLPAERVNDDRVYRTLDRLLPHKVRIEQHLVKRLGELFALGLRPVVVRRDQHVFRGTGIGKSAGTSRSQSRPSARLQASVHRPGGDSRRMPLGYEVFDGNRNDVTPSRKSWGRWKRYGLANRIWVMDRG